MKQVIVLLAMVIVGLVLFTGLVALGDKGKTAITAADGQVADITTTVEAIKLP